MHRDATAHQRAGLIAMLLIQGNKLTTKEVARLTGVSWHGANYMMQMLSIALPIVKEGEKWQWALEPDLNGE